MAGSDLHGLRASRGLRAGLSAALAASLAWQPAMAIDLPGRGGGDAALNACATERAPLVQLDKQYKDMKRSKLGAAIGEGLKKGAAVIATGVMNGGMSGRFGGGMGGFGAMNPMGAMGGMMGMMAGQAAAGGAPAATPVSAPAGLFGPDVLNGALGLQVPGLNSGGFSGGDNMKAYAALAVLVAIVGTIEAYAQLKEQEAGGDLMKASYNIDQDAARQLSVTREMASSASALADCRQKQLGDLNTRLASASNDKDRKSLTRERTQYIGALQKDIDLTGGLVTEHAGMAKTFTQGRAMTGGASEAEVLGGQAPAYAEAPSTTRLSMPAKTTQASVATTSGGSAAPPTNLVTLKATAVRSAPVASAAPLMSFPAGRTVTPKTAQPEGGWYEIDVAGQSGYVRAADVGPPGSGASQVATSGKGKGRGAAAGGPPQLAAASNIRAYNQSVIAVRDTSKSRLGSLMTDIQTSQRNAPSFWASLLARLG